MAAGRFSSSQVEKAKEAISFLSSILDQGSSSSSSAPPSGESSGTSAPPSRPTTVRPAHASSEIQCLSSQDSTSQRLPDDPDFESTRSQGLRKATDRALNALKGMRRGLKGNGERKKRLKSELASAFTSKSKKPKKCAWKHRFVCLAWRDQHKIPTTDVEKDDLLEAGLGEKVIEFPSLDANGEEFKEILYSEYPKLRDGGGFELCRCLPNSRNLEALTSVALSSPAMLKERVGNARTYIRPLQCDLDMDAVLGLPEGPKEECLKCGLKLPLSSLKDHVDECGRRPPLTPSPPPTPLSSPELPITLPKGNESESHGRDLIWMGTYPIDIEQEFVEAAIKESMSVNVACEAATTDHAPVAAAHIHTSSEDASDLQVIRLLQHQVMASEETLCIDVRRDYVLTDALREARKKKFDPRKPIKVTFVGEGAIDHGGPRREFFRLLAKEASEHYFHGAPGCKFFTNNVIALQNSVFLHLGQYAAMSVIQGGSGFPFLSIPVYSYISSGKYTKIEVMVDDIPDPSLKFAIEKIKGAEDDNELKATLAVDEISDLLLQTGFNKPLTEVTTAEKDEVASAMIDFHLMAKVKCIMDQFMEGLKIFDLLDKIKQQPSVWEPLFVHSTALRLTEDGLKSLFSVRFAEKGSNFRREQEQAYLHFVDFLDECSEGDSECSLEDVLVFFSGAAHIPPLGFEKEPTLTFNQGCRLATASTCDLQLRIPTIHGNSYSSFREAMILSCKGNDGFGGV